MVAIEMSPHNHSTSIHRPILYRLAGYNTQRANSQRKKAMAIGHLCYSIGGLKTHVMTENSAQSSSSYSFLVLGETLHIEYTEDGVRLPSWDKDGMCINGVYNRSGVGMWVRDFDWDHFRPPSPPLTLNTKFCSICHRLADI